MAITAQPEILRPSNPAAGRRGAKVLGKAFDDEHLDLLSHLLDDFIRIPGTPIRFGLDGIVGFIPGVGDVLGGLASTIIIFAAWARGVPKVTLARMVLNVAIETAVGSIPVLGNLFDIGWRANRRNYTLLRASLHEPALHAGRSWLFIAGVCVALALLMVLPMLLIGWALAHLAGALHGVLAGQMG
jgi:hypothetical protein